MDNTQKAKQIIEKIIYLTLSTCSKDGQPWISPVYTAYDKNYNFYWASWKDSQHSKNVNETGLVTAVIYDSTVPEGTGEGVFMRGKAVEVNDRKEIDIAQSILRARKNKPPRSADEFMGDYPRRIYKFTPEEFWINGEGESGGHYIDVRTPIDLLKKINPYD